MSHCTDVFSATCFISGHTVFAGLIRRDLHMRSTRSANDAATLSISGGSDPEGGDPLPAYIIFARNTVKIDTT